MRLIHLVDSNTEHDHVKEDDLGEVVDSFAEGEVLWDGTHLTQALLLDDDAVQSHLESVAHLTEGREEKESDALFLSTMLGFKFLDQSVVDWSQSVPHESQCGFSYGDWHFYRYFFAFSSILLLAGALNLCLFPQRRVCVSGDFKCLEWIAKIIKFYYSLNRD